MKIRHIILLVLTLLAASFAVNAQTNPEGLYLKKTVIEDPSMPNKYSLNLEAFITGVKKPGGKADVMFILDMSSSINDNGKLAKLQNAACAFVDVLTNSESRIGIVTFNNSATLVSEFVYVKDNAATLKSKINSMSGSGSTYPHHGFDKANKEFEKIKNDETPKFCIFLTDGKPMDYSEAKYTWNQADYVKKTKDYGVKIYSILLGSDETSAVLTDGTYYINPPTFLNGISSNYGKVSTYKNKTNTAVNKGQLLTDCWDLSPVDTKYYKNVETEGLEDVFKDIAKEVSEAALPLSGEATEVIDIVSNSFKLPDIAFNTDGTLKSEFIKLYAVKCTGTRPLVGVDAGFEYVFDDEHPIALPTTDPDHPDFANVQVLPQDANKKKITVTGFDFEKNYVAVPQGETARGYKLVIKFNIVIDPSFPGGASAVTNEVGSGIYFDADGDGTKEQIGWFPVPSVKLPNIVVIKNGLHKGESAIFKVYKIENGNRSALPLMLVATQGDNLSYAIAKVKIQKPGRYEVEETGWSWAYTIDGRQSAYGADDKNITDEQWNEKGYGTGDEYAFPIPSVTGTEVPDNSTSIIRNVNDFTEENSPTYNYKGTFFIFTNKDKESTPAHAEANKNNEFYECN